MSAWVRFDTSPRSWGVTAICAKRHRGSRGRAVTFGGRLNRLWAKARLQLSPTSPTSRGGTGGCYPGSEITRHFRRTERSPPSARGELPDRQSARPEAHLQATTGLNDISVLSKSRYGRSLTLGKAVIWRMPVKRATTLQKSYIWLPAAMLPCSVTLLSNRYPPPRPSRGRTTWLLAFRRTSAA
jgi:hypothetical protein